MPASFYIIVRNGFSMNFSIRGSTTWWSRERMVPLTALDIQVSPHNPIAMLELEDSMTLVKTLYMTRKYGQQSSCLSSLSMLIPSVTAYPTKDVPEWEGITFVTHTCMILQWRAFCKIGPKYGLNRKIFLKEFITEKDKATKLHPLICTLLWNVVKILLSMNLVQRY